MFQQEHLHTLYNLWKHPGAGRKDIVAFQNRKIRSLIRHAYRNVGYYKHLFDRAGINPQDVRTAQDLSQIPVTEKNDLRAYSLDQILSRHSSPDQLISHVTSGSSGAPFLVWRSRLESRVINMFGIRVANQLGQRFNERSANIMMEIPGENRTTLLNRLRQAAGIYRYYDVNCLLPAEEICQRLEELDPEVISGYAGAVAHVAPFAEGRFANKKLRYVRSSGEALTPVKRKAIERGFGVRVFDVFGSHECDILAWECSQTGLYHVCDDNVVVDVIRDGQQVAQGEKGEVVITALHSYTMPFIRFNIGDIVVKGPEVCPCGQPFSTFHKIEGRIREYFRLPDGRRIHPLGIILPVITENAPWLNQFQMVQETKTSFVLRLTVLRQPEDGELETIKKLVIDKLGSEAEFRVELVDHIPFESSGKFKDSRCLIQPDDD